MRRTVTVVVVDDDLEKLNCAGWILSKQRLIENGSPLGLIEKIAKSFGAKNYAEMKSLIPDVKLEILWIHQRNIHDMAVVINEMYEIAKDKPHVVYVMDRNLDKLDGEIVMERYYNLHPDQDKKSAVLVYSSDDHERHEVKRWGILPNVAGFLPKTFAAKGPEYNEKDWMFALQIACYPDLYHAHIETRTKLIALGSHPATVPHHEIGEYMLLYNPNSPLLFYRQRSQSANDFSRSTASSQSGDERRDEVTEGVSTLTLGT